MGRFAALLVALSLGASAQPARPKFEVATVKVNTVRDGSFTFDFPAGGGFTARNCTLKVLMGIAYDVRDYQLPTSPGWIADDGFDIAAKPAAGGGEISREQTRRMLQSLLEERFHMTLHRETVQRPVYSLTAGKNGPRLGEAGSISDPTVTRMGQIVVSKMPMSALAVILGFDLKRPVMDATGLKGDFAFRLEWAPGLGEASAEFASKPSVFVAVQEQLGLKLESTTGPVEIVVIDSINRTPAEN